MVRGPEAGWIVAWITKDIIYIRVIGVERLRIHKGRGRQRYTRVIPYRYSISSGEDVDNDNTDVRGSHTKVL